jgi:hypothetical protein
LSETTAGGGAGVRPHPFFSIQQFPQFFSFEPFAARPNKLTTVVLLQIEVRGHRAELFHRAVAELSPGLQPEYVLMPGVMIILYRLHRPIFTKNGYFV